MFRGDENGLLVDRMTSEIMGFSVWVFLESLNGLEGTQQVHIVSSVIEAGHVSSHLIDLRQINVCNGYFLTVFGVCLPNHCSPRIHYLEMNKVFTWGNN